MKKITYLLLLCAISTTSFAQIKGDKNIVSSTFPIQNLQEIEINLTGEIVIDMAGAEEITITTDKNLLPFIGRDIKNGKMNLTQLEWISSSQGHQITIGAPALQKLISDAHSDVYVNNMSVEDFTVEANVGTVYLNGTAANVRIVNNVATVNASGLVAQNGDINITNWGSVTANVVKELSLLVDKNGKVDLVNTPLSVNGKPGDLMTGLEERVVDESIQFINFKIKNNSWNRNKFVVVGPKPDGTSFSYGFALWPRQSRSERWTVGTKIYKKNSLGARDLLVTIQPEDENQVVNLFN